MNTSYSRLGVSYLWIFSAFLALVCYTVGAVIMAQQSEYPFHLMLTLSLAFGIFSIILMIVYALKHRFSTSYFPSLSENPVISNKKLAPGVVIGILVGILTSLGELGYMLAWHYDENGRGIIVTIACSSTILSLLIAHFFLQERFHTCELIGILISTIGICLISVQSGIDGTYISYIGGIFTFTVWGIRNVFVKKMHMNGLGITTGIFVNTSVVAIFGVFLLAILEIWGFSLFEEQYDFYSALGGSFLVCGGVVFVNHAIITGRIGVSLTICNSQGAWFILLEFLLFGILPSTGKIVGAIIAILGISIIFTGQSCLELCKKSNSN